VAATQGRGMQRPGSSVSVAGRPVTWLGVNFWSRTGGPLMWRNYDGAVVRAELRVLREHGLGLTRSFFYWPDFHPEPHRLDETLCERFADFLDAHGEVGMATIPTFIVGHMSGENWDPVWRQGRDLYRDTWMVARQAWYARELTTRFAAHPAVAGWLVSNEMPIYGEPAEREAVSSWAELMVQAIRAGGGTQPVSIGDGAWGIEVTGRDNGFSVRDLGAMSDFVGPHVYPMEDDVVRQHLKAALTCELSAVADRPVVLEEFGLSSDFVSQEHAAHYYRQVLHLSLLGGATGWIAWNNTDYDHLVDQDPYRHHAFEMHFGITTNTGEPKPPLRELAAFRTVLDAVEPTRCERWPTQTALVVPSYLEIGAPFTHDEHERQHVFSATEQAHIAAREADLRPGFERETDGIAGGYNLYLVPSCKALTAPAWHRLDELARSGATVFVSYGTGDSPFQRGPWWPTTERLFGVRTLLTYGLNDPIEDETVELVMERPWGHLPAGATLRFRAGGGAHGRAHLPVEPAGAEVLARDSHGRAALLRHEIGAGQVVLCTYPIEYLAAATARVNPEDTWRLYRALASAADLSPPVGVDDPAVLVDGLTHEDGRRFAWLVSEAPHQLTVRPEVEQGHRLCEIGQAVGVDEVTLEPYGVRVLELIRTPAPEAETTPTIRTS
jgi:endo-1,4-beta-mannosidase